ncbi:entericidin A/B family lipoprotein [Mannheimia bovis]|uniref:Entericidin A/B family lipoprotein n=2 Tax=Mannheimia TaxID=75984 RepID=A0A7H1C1Z0_9PAST|nr:MULTISPECIES: entericidin A/B family lipoprotein [Mannheimia]AHG73777.1 Entericidin EcnAB [Mannheimia sp. USDA-ARS-USMARC-1261]QNS14995.1 entericidin A/B family lipoprotein [Mannheimia bovis]WHP46897.1 entericidin A/B family lipoprotein [Mannheimia bovis]
MKKLVLAILASATFLTACNTVDGVGKDVEKAGDQIQKAAQ